MDTNQTIVSHHTMVAKREGVIIYNYSMVHLLIMYHFPGSIYEVSNKKIK